MSGRTEVELLSALERALVADDGGDELELSASATSKNATRFAASTIHQNGSEEQLRITARVARGAQIGASGGNDLSSDGLRALIAEARRLAVASPPTPKFSGFPEPGPLPPGVAVDPELQEVAPAAKTARLAGLFAIAARNDAELHGSFTTQVTTHAIASRRGIRAAQSTGCADANFIAIHGQASGFAGEASRCLADLPVEARAEEALAKARLAVGEPREILAGDYDVVLEPAAVSEMLEWLSYVGFSSQAFEQGSTFLCQRENQSVTGERIDLWDDASDPSGLPCRFDAEGVGKVRTPLIERGIARGPALDKITADRVGRRPTGHALGGGSDAGALPTNLFLGVGSASVDELVGGIERGIWVTRFHYLNGFLDPKRALMTGMTRDGTFWIENGRVVAPLANLRWTESALEAFGRVDALGREPRTIAAWYGGGAAHRVPAIRIRGFRITGVSKR